MQALIILAIVGLPIIILLDSRSVLVNIAGAGRYSRLLACSGSWDNLVDSSKLQGNKI